MKKLFVILLVLGLVGRVGIAMETDVIIDVNGMVCAFCAQGIHKSMMAQDGIEAVDVDLDAKEVRLDIREGVSINADVLRKVVEDAGYSLEGIRYEK